MLRVNMWGNYHLCYNGNIKLKRFNNSRKYKEMPADNAKT